MHLRLIVCSTALIGAALAAGSLTAAVPMTDGHARLHHVAPESAGMSTARLALIDDVMRRAIAAGGFPGGAVIVGRRGSIVWERGYGTLDWTTGTPAILYECFSDWGWGVKLLLVPAAPVGHSLLSAVGAAAAASWGPEGGRPNLSDELRGNCLPLGSGLLPGSPRPSSPRERHGSASALGGNSISFRRRSPRHPCPSGTRYHRPTSGAGW